MTPEEIDAMMEDVWTRGGNPEWLMFPCGCEWNGVKGEWAYQCGSGSWCSFLKVTNAAGLRNEWRLDEEQP